MSLVTTLLTAISGGGGSGSFSSITVTGTSDLGNLQVSANTVSATNTNGDVVLTPNGLGQVEVGANSTHASRLRFKEDTDNGVNYITIGAPASLSADADYTLPTAVPGSNDLVMVSSTAGQLSFGNVTGTAAVQADQETGTSLVVPVVPGVQHYHPSAAKSWVNFQIDGTVDASYNVASIVDSGAGNWTVNIDTDMSTAAYSAVAIHEQASTNTALITFLFTQTVGQSVVRVVNTSGTLTDPEGDMRWVAFGDQ